MKRNIWVMIQGKFPNNGFGNFSQEAATAYGIKGRINMPDESTAIIEAEGDSQSLGGFIQKITNGNVAGKIRSFEIRNGILRDYPFFQVMFNQKEVKNANCTADINGLFLP